MVVLKIGVLFWMWAQMGCTTKRTAETWANGLLVLDVKLDGSLHSIMQALAALHARLSYLGRQSANGPLRCLAHAPRRSELFPGIR